MPAGSSRNLTHDSSRLTKKVARAGGRRASDSNRTSVLCPLFFRFAEIGDRIEHVRRHLLHDRGAYHLPDRGGAEDGDGHDAGDARPPTDLGWMKRIVPSPNVVAADRLARALQILDRFLFFHPLMPPPRLVP